MNGQNNWSFFSIGYKRITKTTEELVVKARSPPASFAFHCTFGWQTLKHLFFKQNPCANVRYHLSSKYLL